MGYLVNLCPIALNLLLLPFWYLEQVFNRYGTTSFYELILNAIVTPIFLLVFNIHRIKQKKERWWLLMLMMFISVAGSAFIHYCNWGITCGRFFSPDGMTVALGLWLDFLFPLTIIVIGMMVYGIVYAIKLRKRTK